MTVGMPPWRISGRFVRFILVGGVNTLFGYAVYALFLWLGCDFRLAATLSTVIGILFNFKTTGRLVFSSTDNRLIFRFIGIYGVNYLFGISGLWLFHRCGVDMYLAGILMIPPSAVMMYLLSRNFVFREAQPYPASASKEHGGRLP